MNENLWPSIDLGDETTPLDLLKDQGNFLEKITDGQLYGEVDTTTEGNIFKHKLYIIPEKLRNYRFLLVEIMHGLLFYPVYYYDHSKKIEPPTTKPVAVIKSAFLTLQDFANMYQIIPSDIPTPDAELNDINELIEMLKKTFNSEIVKKILRTMLLQSRKA